MRHFILETSIILRNPAILSKGNEQIRFVIPEPVIDELASLEPTRESASQVLNLVKNAIEHGAYRLNLPSNELLSPSWLGEIKKPRLSLADYAIVLLAEYYQKQLFPKESDSIFLATDDKQLALYAESLGIKTIDSNALKDALINSSVTNQEIKREASSVTFLQRKELILGLFFGILVSLITNLIATNFNAIVKVINIWGTIVMFPMAGIFLFWFRSRNRLAYGIAEVLFGLITGLRVFIPNFNYLQLDTPSLLQIAGGLYIIVRGMDNLGKGLIGTRFEINWKRWFREL